MDYGFKYAKKLCEELDIEPTQQRTRKKKWIYADGFADAGLSYKQELTRLMFTSLVRSPKRSRHDSSNFMNWITNFASWYHQSFWILNTTAIWIVYLLTLVRKSFNLRGNDCKTSLPDQNDKMILLWATDLLNFYNLSNSSTSVFLFQILS